ncbi:ABC transporter permease [Helicobacter sp. MIT 14-3879]|uniref:ABC transporter permease n=1 Tax=Helicobacter sp. MIT 14-3879 TaxID=2040649 RepID=UPI000E1F36AF|nr:ABC transporter permease [Helicobacter sp. MIT 14-3879]RDU62084.1 ABC transporter permease [Helicobacter sp. MIT 14-3879]
MKNIFNIIINLFDLVKKELSVILTSFSIMTVIIAGNIIYAFFYPSPYLNDILLKQKIAVVDDDVSSFSRQLIFNANASSKIQIIANTSMQEAKQLIEQNKIYGILYIPKDFEKNAINSSIPKLYYMANNSYFLIYSNILEGLNNAANALDFENKKRLFNSQTIKQEKELLKIEFIPLYNPSVGYLNYILAVILIFILHQTILISCGILCGMQVQQYNQGKREYFSSVNPFWLIFSRISAFIIIYFPLFLFYFGFIYDFYNLTTFAGKLELICFGVVFIVSASSFGIFIGFIFNRREYPPQIVLVMSMPLLFALGVIWPNENIPYWIKFFMDFIPITASINGFLKINQFSADFSKIWGEFLHLFLLGTLYSLASYLILRKRFSK